MSTQPTVLEASEEDENAAEAEADGEEAAEEGGEEEGGEDEEDGEEEEGGEEAAPAKLSREERMAKLKELRLRMVSIVAGAPIRGVGEAKRKGELLGFATEARTRDKARMTNPIAAARWNPADIRTNPPPPTAATSSRTIKSPR